MDIAEIEIIDYPGYNAGVKTTMEKHRAEQLKKDKKVKILKILTSNKLAPQDSTKAESEKKPLVEKEAKGKKHGGKK